MSTGVFPKRVESFYSSGEHYLGNNPIFNPFMLPVNHLTDYQELFKKYPLLNYGMSRPGDLPSEDKPLKPEDRFSSQVRLLLNTVHKLGNVKGGHLLEVGSGTGCGAFLVDNTFHPASLNGVDYSPAQVARAKKISRKKDHIHFHKLSAADIARQFGPEQFDGIYSVEMVQHLNQDTLRRFFEGSHITLKPGKKLAFCSFFSINDTGQGELRKVFPTVDLGFDFMHNIADIRQMLEQTGFKDVQIESIGEYVWKQLVRWCNQVAPNQTWSNAYLKVFPELLDYYIVTGTKE